MNIQTGVSINTAEMLHSYLFKLLSWFLLWMRLLETSSKLSLLAQENCHLPVSLQPCTIYCCSFLPQSVHVSPNKRVFMCTCVSPRRKWGGNRGGASPRLRVGVLLISPAMKEDSVCFRTVSFHILRIRLWKREHRTLSCSIRTTS